MANIRLIRRRIKSTKNIAQITRAMEMVAASKMKKAQERATLGKAYAEKIYQATRELATRTQAQLHPLLSLGNREGRRLVILITSNKGLCGGLNTNLFRQVMTWFPTNHPADYVSVGKKGENFIVRSGRSLVADFSDRQPFYDSVAAITEFLVRGFVNQTYGEVWVVYNLFVNALRQLPSRKTILPLSLLHHEKSTPQNLTYKFYEYVIEPGVTDVLGHLLPHYLENQLRSAIFEAEASEHSARMMAMKNATDAAMDFMEGLTLLFNKARQEKITYEIADMVTARMAVE